MPAEIYFCTTKKHNTFLLCTLLSAHSSTCRNQHDIYLSLQVLLNVTYCFIYVKNPAPTQEDVSDLEALLMENVRVLPIRVQPLLDIIIDEAQDYFDGTKSIDQVRTVVKNRLQLYLNERH